MAKFVGSPKDELEMPKPPPRVPSIPALERPPEPPVSPIKKTPPLFIKIDKYTDIVKNIQSLKSYSMSLRDALDAIAEIETELKTGLAVTQKALERFNTIIALLDAKLLRIQGIEGGESEALKEADDMSDYVKRLYDQMEKIRHEIKTI